MFVLLSNNKTKNIITVSINYNAVYLRKLTYLNTNPGQSTPPTSAFNNFSTI